MSKRKTYPCLQCEAPIASGRICHACSNEQMIERLKEEEKVSKKKRKEVREAVEPESGEVGQGGFKHLGPFPIPPYARHCIVVTTGDASRYATTFIYEGEISNDVPQDAVNDLLAAKGRIAQGKIMRAEATTRLRDAARTPLSPANKNDKEE